MIVLSWTVVDSSGDKVLLQETGSWEEGFKYCWPQLWPDQSASNHKVLPPFFIPCWTALPWNYELTEITIVYHLLPTTKKVNDTSRSNREWSCLAEKILASLPSSVSMSEIAKFNKHKRLLYLNPWLGYPSSCYSLFLYFTLIFINNQANRWSTTYILNIV